MRIKTGDGISDIYLDNVGLYIADVTLTDWDSYLHFLYNETDQTKRYLLSLPMTDYLGNSYSGSINVAPWESNVLIGIGSVTEDTGTPIPSGTGAFSKSRLGVPLKDSTGKMLIIQ
jgi:hypothetical protein